MELLTRRTFLMTTGAAVIMLTQNSRVQAALPLTVTIPFPVGNSADILVRILADKLQEKLDRPVVVMNRVGANGTIAASEFKEKAAPDGSSLLVGGSGTLLAAPYMFNHLSYDPKRDLLPVGYIGAYAFVLVVSEHVPVNDMRSFLDYARSQDKPFWCGQANPVSKLLVRQFCAASGLPLFEQAVRSESQLLLEMKADRVQWSIMPSTGAAPHVKAGALKAIAIATPDRSLLLPDVPTMAEAGMQKYTPLAQWIAFIAPAGLPDRSADDLNRAINEVLGRADTRETFAKNDVAMRPMTIPAFREFLQEEAAKWERVLPPLNIPKI